MTIILVIAVVAIAGAVVALALAQSGKISNAAPNKQPARKIPPTAQNPSQETTRFAPPVSGARTRDAGVSGMHEDLRHHLVKGIDKIFDTNASAPEAFSLPRTRAEVDPRILQETMTHLAGMDQFRIQQVRLQKLLNDPSVQMTDVSRSITSDPLMTARVLKMANSSYFGVAQKIDSIGHALMILGLHNIKNIMYREGLRGLFYAGQGHKGVALAALWRHSNLVCICAQHFHDLFEGLNRGTLFTLGIVHDIGKLTLMEKFHSFGKAAGPGSEYPMDMLIGEEDQIFGINHAVIGGCILEQWNFSELMTRAVSMHHTPSFVEADQTNLSPEALKYVLALFLSDQVARLFTDWNEGASRIYPLRGSYHGLIDKKQLIRKVIDTHFLNQMQAAEMLAAAEHDPGNFANALPV